MKSYLLISSSDGIWTADSSDLGSSNEWLLGSFFISVKNGVDDFVVTISNLLNQNDRFLNLGRLWCDSNSDIFWPLGRFYSFNFIFLSSDNLPSSGHSISLEKFSSSLSNFVLVRKSSGLLTPGILNLCVIRCCVILTAGSVAVLESPERQPPVLSVSAPCPPAGG